MLALMSSAFFRGRRLLTIPGTQQNMSDEPWLIGSQHIPRLRNTLLSHQPDSRVDMTRTHPRDMLIPARFNGQQGNANSRVVIAWLIHLALSGGQSTALSEALGDSRAIYAPAQATHGELGWPVAANFATNSAQRN